MKKFLLPLAIVLLIAACSQQVSPPATAEPTPLVIQTAPATATPTPSLCPPGWYATTDGCARSTFLAPIPEDFGSNNIASPDAALFAIGKSGTVYAVTVKLAQNGVSMPEGVNLIINLGTKDGNSQFGMIEMAGETEMKYDGSGMSVLGGYHPVIALDRWYDTADTNLAEEIRVLVEKINAKNLCFLPYTDPSPARLCRPFPTPSFLPPQATPTP